MPIYGYELIGKPYRLVKNMSKKEIEFYQLILKQAKLKCKYKNDKAFCDSIVLSTGNNKPFILANFDKNKTLDNAYIEKRKDYIKTCNKIMRDTKNNDILSTDKNLDYYVYNGLLKPITKKVKKEYKKHKKANKERLIDITGNYEIGGIIIMEKNN